MLEKILGIIHGIITLVLLFCDNTEDNKIIIIGLIILNILVVIFFVIRNKYINNNAMCLKKELSRINNEISICDRELFYNLKYFHKKNSDITTINTILNNGVKEYVDYIAQMLSKLTKTEVTVTLRVFKESTNMIYDSELIIIAYSKNCDDDRLELFKESKDNNLKVVSQNTDFKLLIGDGKKCQWEYFYQPDLEKYKNDLMKTNKETYDNQTINWNRYYKSRVVIPIKIENSKLFYKKENEGEDILGFLCADSKKVNAFPDKVDERRFYVSLMETYAHRLYIILNKYKYYLKKREDGGRCDG